jgi:hypothetical protein
MGLRDIGWALVDYNNMTQVRDEWRVFENMVMKLRAA